MTKYSSGSLASALLISLGLSVAVVAPSALSARAEEKVEFQAKKLSADQLLLKQQQSIAFIFKAFKQLPKQQRGRSAPFLKSLAETMKATKVVDAAVKSKDSKSFAVALPKLAQAIAQLDQTYRLAKLNDKKVEIGVDTLNKAWRAYLKRVKGGKAANDKDLAKANGRRIHDMQRHLDRMAQNKHTKGQQREIDRLRKLLAKAEKANRLASQQWYTSIILADFAGYYAGYYYYYAAYEPAYVSFYGDSWQYFSEQVSYSYSESSSYYESYSWESYEESVETSESYDFEQTSEEYSAFELEYEQSEETEETAVEQEYQATDEDKAIDTAEDRDDDQKIDDVGDNPDEEADAQSTVEDNDQADDDQSYLNDDDSDDAATADDVDDDSAAPADNDDDQAAPDDNDGDQAAPDDNNDDQAEPDDNNDDQAAPDDNDGDNGGDDGGDNSGGDNSGGDDGD